MSPDHSAILDLVTPGASVLDLGCGSGELLSLLMKEKGVKAQGIELDDKAIFECVAKGLNVFHDDIDTGLPEYPNEAFDFVILNQSLQQVKKPDDVMREAFRVGKRVIVGIPNFAHLTARCQIFFKGRVPVTPALPYEWYNTPNLHFLSLFDFLDYCRKHGFVMEKSRYIGKTGTVQILPNLFARTGIFLLRRIG